MTSNTAGDVIESMAIRTAPHNEHVDPLLDVLPLELFCMVADQLDTHDLIAMRALSKRYHNLMQTDMLVEHLHKAHNVHQSRDRMKLDAPCSEVEADITTRILAHSAGRPLAAHRTYLRAGTGSRYDRKAQIVLAGRWIAMVGEAPLGYAICVKDLTDEEPMFVESIPAVVTGIAAEGDMLYLSTSRFNMQVGVVISSVDMSLADDASIDLVGDFTPQGPPGVADRKTMSNLSECDNKLLQLFWVPLQGYHCLEVDLSSKTARHIPLPLTILFDQRAQRKSFAHIEATKGGFIVFTSLISRVQGCRCLLRVQEYELSSTEPICSARSDERIVTYFPALRAVGWHDMTVSRTGEEGKWHITVVGSASLRGPAGGSVQALYTTSERGGRAGCDLRWIFYENGPQAIWKNTLYTVSSHNSPADYEGQILISGRWSPTVGTDVRRMKRLGEVVCDIPDKSWTRAQGNQQVLINESFLVEIKHDMHESMMTVFTFEPRLKQPHMDMINRLMPIARAMKLKAKGDLPDIGLCRRYQAFLHGVQTNVAPQPSHCLFAFPSRRTRSWSAVVYAGH